MQLNQLLDWAFMGLIGSALAFGVRFLHDIAKSVNKLNERVAVVIERTETMTKVIDNHEYRLERVEGMRRGRAVKE